MGVVNSGPTEHRLIKENFYRTTTLGKSHISSDVDGAIVDLIGQSRIHAYIPIPVQAL